jgi:SAM-dependent methyltransferase
VVLRFWLIDDLYARPYGRGHLDNLTGTPQYLSWVARKVRPHVGDTVLELGAGIGNITGRLMARRLLYVAAENETLYLHALSNRFLRTPNVVVQRLDPETAAEFGGLENCFDTVLCLNVLEYMHDAAAVLERVKNTLKPGGRIVVLAPNRSGLFCALDECLGHKRRYDLRSATDLLQACGFQPESIQTMNKAGAPPWWIYGKLLGSRRISKVTLKAFDKTVWLWRRLDALLPWSGLSILLVARKVETREPAAPAVHPSRAAVSQNQAVSR